MRCLCLTFISTQKKNHRLQTPAQNSQKNGSFASQLWLPLLAYHTAISLVMSIQTPVTCELYLPTEVDNKNR